MVEGSGGGESRFQELIVQKAPCQRAGLVDAGPVARSDPFIYFAACVKDVRNCGKSHCIKTMQRTVCFGSV